MVLTHHDITYFVEDMFDTCNGKIDNKRQQNNIKLHKNYKHLVVYMFIFNKANSNMLTGTRMENSSYVMF